MECYPCRKCGAKESIRGNTFTDESLRDDHEYNCAPGKRDTNAVPIKNKSIDESKLFPCKKCGVKESSKGNRFSNKSLRDDHERNCTSRKRKTKSVPIKNKCIDDNKLFPCRKCGAKESSKGNRFTNESLRDSHEFNCVSRKRKTKSAFAVKFTCSGVLKHDNCKKNTQLFPCRKCGMKMSKHPRTKKVTSFTDVEMRNAHESNCRRSFDIAEFTIRGSDRTLQTPKFLREVSSYIHDTAKERKNTPIKIINVTLISTDETGTDMPKVTQFCEEQWPLSKMLQAGLWTNVETITCPSGRPTNSDLNRTTKLSKLTILNLPGHPSEHAPITNGSWIKRLRVIKIVKSNTVETLRRLCVAGGRLKVVDVSVLDRSISVSAILGKTYHVCEMRIRLPAGMEIIPEHSDKLRESYPSLRHLTVSATGGVITLPLPFLEEHLCPPGASGLISSAWYLSPEPEVRPRVTKLWGMSSMFAEFPGTHWEAAVASLKELTIDIDDTPDMSEDMFAHMHNFTLRISGKSIEGQLFLDDVVQSKDLQDWCGSRTKEVRLMASEDQVHDFCKAIARNGRKHKISAALLPYVEADDVRVLADNLCTVVGQRVDRGHTSISLELYSKEHLKFESYYNEEEASSVTVVVRGLAAHKCSWQFKWNRFATRLDAEEA